MPRTVLLVEDNLDNQAIYRTILEFAGYTVIEAVSGDAAIAQARAHRPDLILMDVSIPVVDGWEATRTLKGDPATARIPIVALTAHALADDRKRAEEVGFDGYLTKPIEPRRVVAEVEHILGPARGAEPEGDGAAAGGER